MTYRRRLLWPIFKYYYICNFEQLFYDYSVEEGLYNIIYCTVTTTRETCWHVHVIKQLLAVLMLYFKRQMEITPNELLMLKGMRDCAASEWHLKLRQQNITVFLLKCNVYCYYKRAKGFFCLNMCPALFIIIIKSLTNICWNRSSQFKYYATKH